MYCFIWLSLLLVLLVVVVVVMVGKALDLVVGVLMVIVVQLFSTET